MHGTSLGAFILTLAWVGALSRALPAQGARLSADERADIEHMRRFGDESRALAELDEALKETPDDPPAHALRARCRLSSALYDGALEDARTAFAGTGGGALTSPEAAECARAWLAVMTQIGRVDEALKELPGGQTLLVPERDPRDAWALGHALAEAGRRKEARAAFQRGAEGQAGDGWELLYDRARCQRALGLFERAAQTLVAADKQARSNGSAEPDVLVELGEIYFEAYGEIDNPVSNAHPPAELAKEALTLCAEHEGARLLLFRLHRWNWQRTSQTPEQILKALFATRADSIDGLLAETSGALDDGDLPTARADLERLARLAPARREVRTEEAALAWIEHRRDEAQAELAALVSADPLDAWPELAVGWHLLELYRFAEALTFLERAVQRDPRDWMAWIQLGRARANTGDEDGARKALARSVEVGEGRRNAWRDNTQLVLKRMQETMVLDDRGDLRFLWRPDEARVLAAYLPSFYSQAREELAARYGHTPGVTQIEVFHRWEDFSVRSTGFQGYPALGVCFGPVVTAVSPLCELRGTFSWARTSFHEFTHVIHLGLSNNRCPRWVTEGLATWEEGNKKKAWWRNMRRELLDAEANGDILPLRRLNNAFRGPRVLFAYYQSGLLCQMLIQQSGFAPMVRLLQAFDRGADLDAAFREVFAKAPEEIDAEFAAYVRGIVAPLAIEPRWSDENTFRLRFRLERQVPASEALRASWADDWCKVAWGSYLQGQRVDAEEALRLAGLAGDLPPRGEFLTGEMLLAKRDPDGAAAALRAGFDHGGEDYRARMALGSILANRGKRREALDEFQAAEKAFPGYPDAHFSAELELARLYEAAKDEELANQARLRWLDWNAGEYAVRVKVAEWLAGQGRNEEAARLWEEANEVDPFRRHLHYSWGLALAALGRHAEALRESRVGLEVALELDGDVVQGVTEEMTREELMQLAGVQTDEEWEQLSPEERQQRITAGLKASASAGSEARKLAAETRFGEEEPLCFGQAALEELELGKADEARAAVESALKLDPACKPALEAQARLRQLPGAR